MQLTNIKIDTTKDDAYLIIDDLYVTLRHSHQQWGTCLGLSCSHRFEVNYAKSDMPSFTLFRVVVGGDLTFV